MDKEQFSVIMTSLEVRKTLCKAYLGDISTTNDLSKLTLAAAAELKNFCIQEEMTMTNIVMVDLYHVIGMGGLTPPQMMKFTYAIQEYLEYRPTIKALATHLESITSLPVIPIKTQYKLQGLGGITLTSGIGPVVDESAVASETSPTNVDLPFTLEGRTIRVNLSKFDYFAAVAQTIAKSTVLRDRLRDNIMSMKECLGISWTEVTTAEAIGVFKSNDMYSRFTSYYNKRRMDS